MNEQKDKRFNTFIEKMDKSYEVGFSFEDNMKAYLGKNKPSKGVINKINEAMEV